MARVSVRLIRGPSSVINVARRDVVITDHTYGGDECVCNSMAAVFQGCVENRIRSFIVLDLETTGLPYDKPVRITEIAMVAALREHILGYGSDTAESSVPRVLSKVTLCVSPRRIISERAEIITRMLLCNSLRVS